MKRYTSVLASAAVAAAFLVPALVSAATTLTVNNASVSPVCSDAVATTVYCHIQPAINAAAAGDTINVYPGNYDETAPNSTLTAAHGGGTYQFGLFLPASKPGLSLVGVDASGNPITSYAGILAHVTTNSTANFGPDGVMVEGANDTIQALDIGANNPLDGVNKTIEDIANNFTLKYSKI
jgi:hypothetical protein